MAKFETKLLPAEEPAFQAWKARLAPKDSGDNYDLRGAFKTGAVPDPKTGHWPDTFTKPNHPNFSKASIYHPENPIGAAMNQAAGNPPLNAAIKAADPASALGSTRLFPSVEAQRRILGTNTTSPQTTAQKADQAAFDKREGFDKSTPAGGKSDATQILENRAARLQKDPYDLDYAENTSGTFGSSGAQSKASRMNLPAPAAFTPPAGKSPITTNLVAPKPSVDGIYSPGGPFNRVAQFQPAPGDPNKTSSASAAAPAAPATNTTTATPGPAPTPTPTPAPTPVPVPTPTPVPTPPANPTPNPSPGRTTAAGVSNAQAADIQQPTAKNPVPVTPTSPVMNVDDYDKQKPKFAGF